MQGNAVNGHRPKRVVQPDTGMDEAPAREVEDIADWPGDIFGQRVQYTLADVQGPFADQTFDEGAVGLEDDFSLFHK
jgi:hypothetical protein